MQTHLKILERECKKHVMQPLLICLLAMAGFAATFATVEICLPACKHRCFGYEPIW